MTGYDNGLQGLFTRMDTTEKRTNVIKSTLDSMVQELQRLSLKIDDRSLADDTYRTGRDPSSINLPPPPLPSHPPQQLQLYHPSTNLPPPPLPSHPSQQSPPYPPSTNFSQPYYTPLHYTPLHPSMNLQLVLFRDCNATKKTPDTTQRHQI